MRGIARSMVTRAPSEDAPAALDSARARGGWLRLGAGIERVVSRECAAPHRIYASLASVFGLFFVFAMPPMAGNDEPAKFERAYEAATFQWTGAAGTPSGARAFIDKAYAMVRTGEPAPRAEWKATGRAPLAEGDIIPYANPHEIILRIDNPIAYLIYAPAIHAGIAFDMSSGSVLTLCRLSTLIISIALFATAIALFPGGRVFAAFVALSPTVVGYQAAVSIDAVLIACGFLFAALVARRLSEPCAVASRTETLAIVGTAALFGVFKTPYALIPLLAILVPFNGPGKWRRRAAFLASVCLPGLAIAVSWALIAKAEMLGGGAYATNGGGYVDPDAQLRGLIAAPWRLFSIYWATLTNADFLSATMMDLVCQVGWRNTIVPPAWVYISWLMMLALLWTSDTKPLAPLTRPLAVFAQVSVFCMVVGAALLLLYLQWTAVGAPSVEGFQGRYLLPASPLLMFIAPARVNLFGSEMGRTLAALLTAVAALAMTAMTVVETYYA